MSDPRPYGVLFLCTGNSARSIMAEALLNHHGGGRFIAYSAGSRPSGSVHPLTLRVLAEAGLPTEGLRSKSWDEFGAEDARPIDFVITVCDNAASEPCPVWPGHPAIAHWGIPDPAAAGGSEEERLRAFHAALRAMNQRVRLLLNLPIDKLAREQMQARLQLIGREAGK